jgi:hypothetical protein
MPTHLPVSPLLATIVLLCAGGCEAPPIPDGPVPPVDLFHPDRVMDVEIWMDEDDWDELRGETRHYLDLIGASCLQSPPRKRFTWFQADISVDGSLVGDVGVRKKGFYGSVSDEKPSVKVEFDEFVEGQRFGDLKRMTLNNNLADVSQIKQCLGYDLYARAGVPAPRCSFATVSVNGDALGIYTHVEPIKKPFLARHFDNDEGNLYEGALSDFRPGWVDVFERKTNRDDPDRSDIEALVPALTVDDAVLLDTLEPLVDLPRFFEMWAMDVLLMHGDGDLETILAEPPVPWDRPLRDAWCLGASGAVAATFEGTWDEAGVGTITLDLDGEIVSGDAVLRGELEDGDGVIELGIEVEPDRSVILRIPLEWEQLQEPWPKDLALLPGSGTVVELTGEDGQPVQEELRAFLDGATLSLEEAGDEALVGSLEATLYPVLD